MQENIAAYGGDKDNVTIFGESAGSWSVESMLSSKHTVGTFHKAIGQSGCLKTAMLDSDAANGALMGFSKKYFNVETDDQVKDALKTQSIDELVIFFKTIPQALGGFMGRSSSDDFFHASFKELSSFPNKVPFMTGMNATEACCLFMVLGEKVSPGLLAGWTEEQLLGNHAAMVGAMGGDPSIVPAFIEQLKKLYSAGRDMSGSQEYSRLHNLYMGDLVRIKSTPNIVI